MVVQPRAERPPATIFQPSGLREARKPEEEEEKESIFPFSPSLLFSKTAPEGDQGMVKTSEKGEVIPEPEVIWGWYTA